MNSQFGTRTSERMDRLIHERVHDPYKTKSNRRSRHCVRCAMPSSKRVAGNGRIRGRSTRTGRPTKPVTVPAMGTRQG
jgi:hypothetical protein